MNRSALNSTFAVGFLALAAGTFVARANPATGYESSIFTGTPTATWAGFGVALAIALVLTLACRGRYQALAIALGATTVTAIVSLPLVRNYRFFGMGDALTHVGWTRDIVGGGLYPHDLFYPGVHSLGAVIHFAAGVPIERALLLSMVILFVPFLVFVPLVVRDITGDGLAAGVAAIISWMVLPINNIATHMGVHTNSNALFLVPVVLFAVVAYLRRRSTVERLPFGLSPFSVVIYLSGIALLLVHPQQMVNVVVLVGAVAGVQHLARQRYDEHPILEHPSVRVQASVLGVIFAVWTLTNDRFQTAVAGLVTGMFSTDVGGGETVDQRGGSLTEIGGSLGELFVKLFLDAAVIGLVVALFVLLVWLGWTAVDRETSAFVTYLSLALFPLGGILLVYFVGTPTMAFRQIGFIYVVLTILGGIAIAHGIGGLSRYLTMPGANAIAAVLLGACLVLGLLTVYASPLIYSPTQHVSDQQYNGYQTGFDRGAEDRPHAGLGYDPFRFDHGLYGLERPEPLTGAGTASGEVDPEEFESGNYAGAYHETDYYLIVTGFDVAREIEVYQELHYSEEALTEASQEPGVSKVVSNDEFEMYAINSSAGSTAS